MDSDGLISAKGLPLGLDSSTEEDYESLSKLLQEFTEIPTVDKAWSFRSANENSSSAMFLIGQPNLLDNKRRKSLLSSHVDHCNDGSVSFKWAPFPIEVNGVSLMAPSPSGSKLLVVKNPEGDSPARFEIWGPSEVKKQFSVPRSVHGSVYSEGWFEGISWNSDETVVAYAAEEPDPPKPTFNGFGYKKGNAKDDDLGSWKGQGDWEEGWGETYAGKKQPALFVINVESGGVCAVKGIGRSLSVGQVIWAPPIEGNQHYLVFVGWPSSGRKLGIKHCFNRPCALYAVKAPSFKADTSSNSADEDSGLIKLTPGISSAFFPRFSPDGRTLIFFSAKNAVESGAHSATDSLHKIDWPSNGKLSSALNITDVVPVPKYPENGDFPGLYFPRFLTNPWLSDGCTVVLSSVWGSVKAILSVDVSSVKVSRISPKDSNSSWELLALDGDNLIAVCSSPVDIPQIMYGKVKEDFVSVAKWDWFDVFCPATKSSEKVASSLSSKEFRIMEIPVKRQTEELTKGTTKPFEAIFMSSKSEKREDHHDPLIVVLHGGPHSVWLSSFVKSSAFLCSLGYSLLMVNYRGSLGFGEEALQSLPGRIGDQDVSDVLAAIDYTVDKGLADQSKVLVLGGSHGGFLTTHLIGQAPDRFVAAAVRNPVCNLSLMVGTTDIPDWCFTEAYGREGNAKYTEAPSIDQLELFYGKSPIAHVSKVKAPTLMLIGAQDLRVPPSNGIQYARALKERGVEAKVIVFPNDIHGIDKPQSDFESFLNIGVWFRKYCR